MTICSAAPVACISLNLTSLSNTLEAGVGVDALMSVVRIFGPHGSFLTEGRQLQHQRGYQNLLDISATNSSH